MDNDVAQDFVETVPASNMALAVTARIRPSLRLAMGFGARDKLSFLGIIASYSFTI